MIAEAKDFGPTPRESVASQGSQQIGETASLSPQASNAVTPSPVSKQAKTRGPGKSKRPGPRQSEDKMSPGVASKTPPGSAKGVSTSHGEAKKLKGARAS